jgi:hypothetical protein
MAIVTLNGPILVSKNLGKTWSITSAPILDWESIDIDSTGQNIAAVAHSEGVYTSANGGEFWTHSLFGKNDWKIVAVESSGELMAVVAKSGHIYCSKNSGLEWNEFAEKNEWIDVVIDSTGQNLIAITEDKIFRSYDLCQTWEASTNTPSGKFLSITVDEIRNEAYLLSVDGDTQTLFHSSNLGSTWSMIIDEKFLFPSISSLFEIGTQNSFSLQSALVSDVPSSQPTSQPTTEKFFYTFQFEAVFQLNKVRGTTLNKSAIDTLLDAISNLISVPLSNLKYIGVISAVRRKLINYNSVVTSVLITLHMYDYPAYKGNSTKLFNDVKSIILQAVDDGSFAVSLQNGALVYNATQLLEVLTSHVEFKNFFLYKTSPTPSSIPSSAPTSVPTSSPTSVPSSQPSGPPTPNPTLDPNYYIQFDVFLGLFNVSDKTLSWNGAEALVQTIHDITDVLQEDIHYVGITNAVDQIVDLRRRKLLKSVVQPQLKVIQWNMVVQLQVTVPLYEFPQFKSNSTKLFNYLKTLLVESVHDKTFETLLRYISQSTALELLIVEVREIQFKNFILLKNLPSPTGQPSSQPTGSPTLSISPDALQFEAYWGIYNISGSPITVPDETALLTAMIDVMDIPLNQVRYDRVTDELFDNPTYSMVIQTEVEVPLADYDQLDNNATKIYNFLTALLSDSVADNTFTKLLRKEARTAVGAEFYWAVVFKVEFKNFRLKRHTRAPSFLPTALPTFPGGAISHTPTLSPTVSLAPTVSIAPSFAPTTAVPTISMNPTIVPTTAVPTISFAPTVSPTTAKPTISLAPSVSPTTAVPTISMAPSVSPTTAVPTISQAPTVSPTTATPTISQAPSFSPTTAVPTISMAPSVAPTTAVPTISIAPSVSPTTAVPTISLAPSVSPTTSTPTISISPSAVPTTSSPTISMSPTVTPTTATPTVSQNPSASPTTAVPTISISPTVHPTTATPTVSLAPTVSPTTASPTISQAPTVAPSTAVPTISLSPTVSPTTAKPTISLSPSAVPTTSHPTVSFAPTISLHPTRGPTFTPTRSPTISLAPTISLSPTASPSTSLAPTAAPSVGQGTLFYKVILEMAGVGDSEFSLTDESIVTQTIAAIIPTVSQNIEFLSIRDITRTSRQRRRRLDTYSMTVASRAFFAMSEWTKFEGNATKVYLNTTGNCLDAVESGRFSERLRELARLNNAPIFYNATVTAVTFEDPTINGPQINSKNAFQTPLDQSSLAAIISCSIVGVALLFVIFYFGITKCYQKSFSGDDEESLVDESEISEGEIIQDDQILYRGGLSTVDLNDIVEISIDDHNESVLGMNPESMIESDITPDE